MTPTPKRPAVVRWTSAKRPPEGDENVLVYMPLDEQILLGAYEGGGSWYVYDYGFTVAVSHWRPLPPPPRQRLARPAQRKGKR